MSVYFYDEALLAKLKGWTGNTQINIFGPDETRKLFEVMADQKGDKPVKLPILCLRRKGGYNILNTNKKPLTYDGMLLDARNTFEAKLQVQSSTLTKVKLDTETFSKKINGITSHNYTFIYVNGFWTLGSEKLLDVSEYGLTYKGEPGQLDKVYVTLVTANEGNIAMKLNAIPISIPYQLDVYTRYMKEADAYTRNLVFNIINYPSLKVTLPYQDSNLEYYASIRVSNTVEDNSDVPEIVNIGQFTRMSLNIDIDDAYLWDVRTKDNTFIDMEGIVVQTPTLEDTDFITEQVSV